MTAIKNALEKTRAGLLKALRAPVNGARRLGSGARGGVAKLGGTAPVQRARGGLAKAGGGVGKATRTTRWRVAKANTATKAGVSKALEGPRARISSAAEAARTRPRFAIAIAAGVLIGIAWIAWAIYVTASNGSTAGLGVLLTWPVLIGALALVAAPFVLTGVLVKRHWPGDGDTPPIAGGANGQESPED